MGQAFEQRKVAFFTLGCKLNFSESSYIGKTLEEKGFSRVQFGEEADVVILNTCTVTELAEKKCRQAIKKANTKNPNAIVVVTGCYAQLKPEDIANLEGVDMVLGANEKFNVDAFLDKIDSNSDKASVFTSELDLHKREFHPSYSSSDRTRCFLKVQDGCDYFCTFCTIPFARGRSRNNSVAKTIETAKEAISSGAKEVVLTGVNIGHFGKTTDETFIDLLKALDAIDEDVRFRLGSVEPNLLTDEIIDFVATSQRFVPHFHIPLQSGADEVLRLMKRKYDTALFKNRVEHINRVLPNAFIGVDVIVGMNGETDALFNETKAFLTDLDFAQLHVFSYSERPATVALKIPGKVMPQDKKLRSKQLLNLSDKKIKAFYRRNQNETRTVLWEQQQVQDKMFGFTDNYIKVEAPYNKKVVNTFASVTLGAFSKDFDALQDLNTESENFAEKITGLDVQ